MENTTFVETQTILRALEFATAKGAFGNNIRQKKTAQSLIKQMKSNKSISGRHQQLMSLLKKGASIEQIMKATGASRRTIFRYLNQLEDAGLNIEINDGRYRLK